jgi:hypothetical protein
MTGGRDETTALEVRIGGGPPQSVRVTRGQWRVYRLPVPPELAGQRRLEIDLRAPTFIPAQREQSSDDARALSLMLGEVAVK